jgi:diguanylate cyclase (GGDEF)-like protein
MLDQRTLLVGYSITSLILSLAVLIAARAQRRFRGLELWGCAGLLMGTIPLQIAAHDFFALAPPPLVIHLTVLTAVVCLRVGIGRYTERPFPARLYQTLCVVWLLCELLLLALGVRLAYRAGLLGALLAFALVDTGMQLVRSPRLWTLLPHRTSAALFFAMAVGVCMRALSVMIRGRGGLAFGPTLINPYAVLMFQVMNSCLGMSLMLMVWARLDRELQEHVDHLEDQIIRDPLTGALNRRGLERAAELSFAGANHYEWPVSVICLDIDHFKRVNDAYGHGVGDTVLTRVVSAIEPHLRGSDRVARTGGEEFAVFLPGTDLEAATAIAERLRKSLEMTAVTLPGDVLRFTCSFGVAERLPGETSLTPLLDRADLALYEAKRTGRNRVCGATRGGLARV